MQTHHQTVGKANVYRNESYNHGTTAKVTWSVKITWPCGKIVTVAECKTRKEAMQWAWTYRD